MEEELVFTPADAAIAHWVIGFVRRRNGRGGDVVFELPELRPSIQVMLGDDYWLRERGESGAWRTVPRIALWGPRLTWGYGFARKLVHAFGIGLTSDGTAELTGRPVSAFVDRVVDLAELRPDVTGALARIVSTKAWEEWPGATSALFARLGGERPRAKSNPSAAVLADADSVRGASEAAGIGDRHYRRLFRARHGLSPRLYRRLLRVDRMLKRLHPNPWEEDIHETEPAFADQPHMIREFKALTGVTPGAYARSKRKHGDATLRSIVATGISPPPF